MDNINLAVVGATGLVGSKILELLDEYKFHLKTLKLFASKRSKGRKIKFQNKDIIVEELTEDSLKGFDAIIFSAGSEVAKKYALIGEENKAIIIDNSSAFRSEKDIPLIVPEINISDFYHSARRIIANPNCSTIQAVIPIFAICKLYSLTKIVYSTYQAVSGFGMKGIYDLKTTQEGYDNEIFIDNISKTCIPEIGNYEEDGYTSEEKKMINETKKILHNENIEITSTCVRVPVENGHGVSVYLEVKEDIDLTKIEEVLKAQDGIIYIPYNDKHHYPTSIMANNQDKVIVGRLKKGGNSHSLCFYCTGDNLRKGAAANALQILKLIHL